MKLSKIYEPQLYEQDIYALWEKSGVFTADPTTDKPRFSIAMPPPNETGTLSLGHSLFLTLQDIMARYHRLKGYDVLWLPGTDHAALAVNAIVEKRLTEEGTNKHEIGRDAFLERTRDFVAGSRGTMLSQMRAMGAGVDWSRLRYTLDPSLSRAVGEVFVKMHADGLIYRGSRIVNWDPNLETNVSDDEVVYSEETGKLYTFQYGPFQISTARPETKFGDKYVVVHPDDERYADFEHGDTFEAEWINGLVTATVIKDSVIDREFGTGAMTITPWHSQADFDIAERHGLDKEQIIDFQGKLLPIAQEFAGRPIAEARPAIVEKLRNKGLLVDVVDDYVHNVAINERGKGVIEPQIRLQWFVDVNKPAVSWKGQQRSLKQVMQSVVREGDIELVPGRFDKTYFHWIDNLRDWCISRQIWWGHRIPVWYRSNADGQEETYVGTTPPTDQSEGWHDWEQDPDTLDTWFSSALWTWSTLLDPERAGDYNLSLQELLEQSPDFKAYHPTSVLETGWDILFFWVARMILATTYTTGQIPFKTVYLHGLIRAEDGKKMSKSRPESVIDPLDVIPKYGTDALRMALIMGVSPGNDQNWGWNKIEANRNFCNKLWNIARYIEDRLEGEDAGQLAGKPLPKTVADHWVLGKLQHNSKVIADHIEHYRFAEAYDSLYHFIWDDVADWYIEASKATPNPSVMAYTLRSMLQLAHPFAPFVTETIWQTLAWQPDGLLTASDWPKPKAADFNRQAGQDFEAVKSLVGETRYLSRVFDMPKLTFYFQEGDSFFADNQALLTQLGKLTVVVSPTDIASGLHLTHGGHTGWVYVEEDKRRKYLEDVNQRIGSQQQLIDQLAGRLGNDSYVANAPAAVVEQSRQQLADAKAQLTILKAEHNRFSEY